MVSGETSPKIPITVELRHRLFWYYRLVADNGQVLATSEVYFSKSNALRAARNVADMLNLPLQK